MSEDDQVFAESAQTTVENPPFENVKYVGQATERQISEEAWVRAEVPNQGAVTWDKRNNHTVSGDHFTDKAVEVLRRDSNFTFI